MSAIKRFNNTDWINRIKKTGWKYIIGPLVLNYKSRCLVECPTCKNLVYISIKGLLYSNEIHCKNCKNLNRLKPQAHTKHTNFELITPWIGKWYFYKIRCKKCSGIWNISGNTICGKANHFRCPFCNNLSKIEQRVLLWLYKNKIDFEYQKSFPLLYGYCTNKELRYDIFIPSLKILIEINDEEHFRKYTTDLQRIQLKNNYRRKIRYANNHNINIIEINYKQFINIEKFLEKILQI